MHKLEFNRICITIKHNTFVNDLFNIIIIGK